MSKLQGKDVMAAAILQGHGQSCRSLARMMAVDESTLRYRLRRFRERTEDGRRRQPESCVTFHELIMQWVDENVLKRSRPVPVKILYELLVCEHGFTGSYKSVLRYVRRRVSKPAIRPFRRVEVLPGSQSQVDWFEVPVFVEELGGLVKLHAFVMVLSFSRMWAVIWSLNQDMLNWIRCHNEAFIRLGGIPMSVHLDNLKTGVARGAGAWAEINAGYADYAIQTGFIPDPARVRMGSDKGKVERRGQDMKRLPLQTGERFSTLEELQRVSDARVATLSEELVNPITGFSIRRTWMMELEHLAPLPLSLPEPFDVQVGRKVTRDCLVSFEGRQYEVPSKFVGRTLTVRGCPGEVQIYQTVGELLRVYPRGTACRLLLDRTYEDFEEEGGVLAPTPLGRLGREIVLKRSWEWDVPRRSIDAYHELVSSLS